MSAVYQLFDPLPAEQYQALKADIARRGVMVPVEVDEDGNVLDGHHRRRIYAELGIDCPTVVRSGLDEDGKREHVLKLNLLRRHLGPLAWAEAFRALAELRGVRLGQGKRNDRTSATMSEVAAEVGVSERTARRNLQRAEQIAGHPDLAMAVDSGDIEVKRALRIMRDRVAEERRQRRDAEFAERAEQRLRDGVERVYDIWTSPRQWLLKEADRVEGRPPTEQVIARRLQSFGLGLPSTSGLTHTSAGGAVQQIPDEVIGDPAGMAAIDETHRCVAELRAEAERRFTALHDWIGERRRATVEALRGAADSASDEPTILFGRSYQFTTASGEASSEHDHMGVFTVQDVRNMGVAAWRTLHVPDDCICENATPLGCVKPSYLPNARRCCAAVVEQERAS